MVRSSTGLPGSEAAWATWSLAENRVLKVIRATRVLSCRVRLPSRLFERIALLLQSRNSETRGLPRAWGRTGVRRESTGELREL